MVIIWFCGVLDLDLIRSYSQVLEENGATDNGGIDLIRSYSQVLEENGATDNGGKPNVKGFIRWIVVELLRWRNVEVEWGPVGTASSSVERRATLLDDDNAAVVREGMHDITRTGNNRGL